MWSEKRKREYIVTPLKDRILANVEKTASCWLWTGGKNNRGYGTLVVGSRVTGDRRMKLAHRVAYEQFVGPLADGDVVMHTCDTPACCNPAHLRAGNHQLNMLDAKEKGRMRRGEEKKNHVLNDDLVAKMREIYTGARGEVSKIANMFGFRRETVGYALRKSTWRHVP